jgi:hypothetical protein
MRATLIVLGVVFGLLAVVVVGAVGLVIYVAATTQPTPRTNTETFPPLAVNSLAVLDYKPPIDIYAAKYATDGDVLAAAMYEGDTDEIERLANLGRVDMYLPGTRVRVRNASKDVVRVEVVDSGKPEDNGETRYVMRHFVRPIRPDEPRTFTAP